MIGLAEHGDLLLSAGVSGGRFKRPSARRNGDKRIVGTEDGQRRVATALTSCHGLYRPRAQIRGTAPNWSGPRQSRWLPAVDTNLRCQPPRSAAWPEYELEINGEAIGRIAFYAACGEDAPVESVATTAGYIKNLPVPRGTTERAKLEAYLAAEVGGIET